MEKVTVKTEIERPVKEVWALFNTPQHIVRWNFAHESWECPSATNDLRVGGKLQTRMQAKDGSFGFDFLAVYDDVQEFATLKYHLEDGRNVEIIFSEISPAQTLITEKFDPETTNSVEMQQQGWQAILNSFKNYAERI